MKAGGAPALAVRSLSSHALGVQRIALTRSLRAGEAQVLRASLFEEPDVVDVVVDYRMPLAAVGPDPLLPTQWALGSSAAGIDAAAAWPLSRGEGIVVAVIDSGVRPHVDLLANLAAGGYDFATSVEQARDGDGRDADPTDPGDGYNGTCVPGVEEEPVPGSPPPPGNDVVPAKWHGTKVAGVIAAAQGNAVGIAGVAPRAAVLPVRVAGTCGALASDMIDGIVWAAGGQVPGVASLPVEARADVINLSFGGAGACDPLVQSAIDFAVERGVVVVAASGNHGGQTANSRPANCRNVISVGAIDSDGALSSFSNYGTRTTLVAPGGDVLLTSNSGVHNPAGDIYDEDSGTSFAAPHVAAVVAAIQSRRVALGMNPLSPSATKSLLSMTASPRVAVQCRGAVSNCGAGLLDAASAVMAVDATTETYGLRPHAAQSAVPETTAGGLEVLISVPEVRVGNGKASSIVHVATKHSRPSDIRAEIVAPSGAVYTLPLAAALLPWGDAGAEFAGWDPIKQNLVSAVDLRGEPLAGQWRVIVRDVVTGATGSLSLVSLTF